MSLLVDGYAVTRFDEATCSHFETVFCVTDFGNVFTTGERPANDMFNPRGQVWTRIDKLPTDSHFIGRYETPNEAKEL